MSPAFCSAWVRDSVFSASLRFASMTGMAARPRSGPALAAVKTAWRPNRPGGPESAPRLHVHPLFDEDLLHAPGGRH